MTVLATSSVERHSAVSTEWTVSGQSGAMTTSDGKLRMSGQSEWDLGSTGGTLSSSLAAGLWYRSSGGFLDLDGITGVQLSGSGASPLGAFFTLVLAQNFGFEEQKTAITEFVVNPGQSLSNVVLDFSQLQGFDETFTLATVTDMVIEVKFVVSAGAGNTSGSFNGAYDLSQVALVPSPAVLTVAAAAGLLRRRRKG
jgi:hypothetical protein